MHKLYDWIWFDLIWDKGLKGTFVNLADFSLNYDKSSLVSDYKPDYRSKRLVSYYLAQQSNYQSQTINPFLFDLINLCSRYADIYK